jgi:hypothetical protein
MDVCPDCSFGVRAGVRARAALAPGSNDHQSLAAPMVPHSQRGPKQRSRSSVDDGPHAPAATAFGIADASGSTPRIRSAARSAIAIVGAFVFPRTTLGITDASMTRSP